MNINLKQLNSVASAPIRLNVNMMNIKRARDKLNSLDLHKHRGPFIRASPPSSDTERTILRVVFYSPSEQATRKEEKSETELKFSAPVAHS